MTGVAPLPCEEPDRHTGAMAYLKPYWKQLPSAEDHPVFLLV